MSKGEVAGFDRRSSRGNETREDFYKLDSVINITIDKVPVLVPKMNIPEFYGEEDI